MKTAQEIKQAIADSLNTCGVFDSVLTPSDNRKDATIMREPSAAVYYSGCVIRDDNGVQVTEYAYIIRMKFLKIGVNETADDIELAVNALKELEPASLAQSGKTDTNSRSASYTIDITFAGCRG